MNKLEKRKILNFLLKNTDQFSFSEVKRAKIFEKNKTYRYSQDKEISEIIIAYFFEQNIENLRSQSVKIKEIKSITLKIKNLLEYQLQHDFEKKQFLKKVFLFLITEKKFSQMLDYFFKASSMMWKIAGDTSDDINYYTKRIILSSVYSKIFIKMMSCSAYDQKDIIKDIDNSLDKVRKFNDFKSKLNLSNILAGLKNFDFTSKKTGRGF
jgi:ubiquinone biosynthesis protein COQ9